MNNQIEKMQQIEKNINELASFYIKIENKASLSEIVCFNNMKIALNSLEKLINE